MKMRECWIKGCNDKIIAHSLCRNHYEWVLYWFNGKRQQRQRVVRERVLLEKARTDALKGLTPEQLIAEVER